MMGSKRSLRCEFVRERLGGQTREVGGGRCILHGKMVGQMGRRRFVEKDEPLISLRGISQVNDVNRPKLIPIPSLRRIRDWQ